MNVIGDEIEITYRGKIVDFIGDGIDRCVVVELDTRHIGTPSNEPPRRVTLPIWYATRVHHLHD